MSQSNQNQRGLATLALLMIVGVTGTLTGCVRSQAQSDAIGWSKDGQQPAPTQKTKIERAIRQSLERAEQSRKALHAILGQEGGVFRLLQGPSRWRSHIREAKSALDTARTLLDIADGKIDPKLTEQMEVLGKQLQQDEDDRRLAERLDKIRQDRSVIVEGKLDNAKAARLYPQTFAEAGLALAEGVTPEELSTRIKRSAIREQWLAALDDWATVTWKKGKDQALWRRLLAVARLADPDPWRQQLRTEATWQDERQLTRLADQLRADPAALARQSPQLLDLVGRLLILHRGDAATWLRKAQALHPTDFWLNFDLATALRKAKAGEAAGYYRAALAVRPQSTVAWNNLGVALADQKQQPEAVDAFRQALNIAPQYALAWNNLGEALKAQGDLPGARECFRKALQIDPQFAPARKNLELEPNQKQPKEVQRRYQEKLEQALTSTKRQACEEERGHSD